MLIHAIRDKLFLGLVICTLCVLSISITLGSTSLVEQSQSIVTYISGTMRIMLVIGMPLFFTYYVASSYANQYIDMILSKPISRSTFVLGHVLGILLLNLLVTTIIGLVIYFFASSNLLSTLFWTFSLFSEIVIVSIFAFAISIVTKRAVFAALISYAFYLLTRMMGLCYAAVNLRHHLIDDFFPWLTESIFTCIYMLIPRLDLFTKTEWLIYDINNMSDIFIVLIQSWIYVLLLTLLILFDIRRKQF